MTMRPRQMRSSWSAIVGLLVIATLAACGRSTSAAVSIEPVVATEEASVPPEAGATDSNLEPDAALFRSIDRSTPDPGEPVVTSLEELIEVAGYPADATAAVLRIPVLGLSAQVAPRYVGLDTGDLPLPSGPADIAWYDMSEWPGLGGTPGGGGNAIFSGHVDFAGYLAYADVNYSGLGVFADINLLVPGDVVEVDYEGATLRYSVTTIRDLSAAPGATDWASVWSGDVAVDTITLYTCGGAFDTETQSYVNRVVVQAQRIDG